MKFKIMGRISGVANTTMGSLGGYYLYKMFSSFEYDKLNNFFLEDYPLEYKIGVGAYLGAITLLTPAVALVAIDGLTDIVKGTHHYFGCKLWQKLTRNEKTKKEIGEEIDYIERIREIEIPKS